MNGKQVNEQISPSDLWGVLNYLFIHSFAKELFINFNICVRVHVACNPGLSSCLSPVSIYFSIVFTRFCIIVYPATVSASGCPAPTPVSVKNYENENGWAIFRPFLSLLLAHTAEGLSCPHSYVPPLYINTNPTNF